MSDFFEYEDENGNFNQTQRELPRERQGESEPRNRRKKGANSFEEKLAKIEELLNMLNDESVNLEQSVELYKNGMTLLKEAREILDNAKLTINEFDKSLNG